MRRFSECLYLGHNGRSRDRLSNSVKNKDQWEGSWLWIGVYVCLNLALENIISKNYANKCWLFNMDTSKTLIKFRLVEKIRWTRLLICTQLLIFSQMFLYSEKYHSAGTFPSCRGNRHFYSFYVGKSYLKK